MKFLRQHSILVELNGKASFFVPDFFCAAVGLIVEVDGGIHDQQRDADCARDDVLRAMGYCILRFRNEEVESNIEDVVSTISATPLPLQEHHHR